MKKLNKNGFTMVELLAVFVILGIISMITIPAVTKYIDKARQKDYDAIATSAYSAAANYIMKNDGEYVSTITFDDLEKNNLISNLKDPIDNSKDCGGYVSVSKDDDESDSIFANYKYSVNLCCSQYKYRYSFNIDNTNEDDLKTVKKSNLVKLSDSECTAYIKSSPSPTTTPTPSSSQTPTATPTTTITTTINLDPNGTTYNNGNVLTVKITCDSNGKNCTSNNNNISISGNTATLPSVSLSGYTIKGWASKNTETSNFFKNVSVGTNNTYNYYLIATSTSAVKTTQYIYNYTYEGSCNGNKKQMKATRQKCLCRKNGTISLGAQVQLDFNVKYRSTSYCRTKTNDCVLSVGDFQYRDSSESRPDLSGNNRKWDYKGYTYHGSYYGYHGYEWYYDANSGSSHSYTKFSKSDRNKYLYHTEKYGKMFEKQTYQNVDGSINYTKACMDMCSTIWKDEN